MSDPREQMPRPMRRAALTEAGHRCAIPTCRGTSALQVHHIVDYSKVKEHTLDNLIVLCANCHDRVTKKEIDTLSVRTYKANLSLVNQRYSDMERRLLEMFAQHPEAEGVVLGPDAHFFLHYLLRDGLIREVRPPGANIRLEGGFQRTGFSLTDAGREFVRKWADAQGLE